MYLVVELARKSKHPAWFLALPSLLFTWLRHKVFLAQRSGPYYFLISIPVALLA